MFYGCIKSIDKIDSIHEIASIFNHFIEPSGIYHHVLTTCLIGWLLLGHFWIYGMH